MQRAAGVLCPVFSLNGDYGIGKLGKQALDFVDFLSRCGFSYWQVLPLNPVDSVKSPYASPSAFAGNYNLIDAEVLAQWNLLRTNELPYLMKHNINRVDYQMVEQEQKRVLDIVFLNFYQRASKEILTEYDLFILKNSFWLDDYALFMALKEKFGYKSWLEWPVEFRYYDEIPESIIQFLGNKIEYHKVEQFIFYRQWQKIKSYAKSKNIGIIGDMPIYVSYDSVDVWRNPELFQLNDLLEPVAVAGVPPDFFSENGQLWGFPLYDWSYHEKTNFAWWTQRTRHMFELYDLVRFDHFRGIEAYWSTPAEELTARKGKWNKAPGKALLKQISTLKPNGLLAENLGHISKEVEDLRKEFNIPGMKIFQFAFGGNLNNSHLPHFLEPNDIYYSGTHDNDVMKSWLANLDEKAKLHICDYYGVEFSQINNDWLISRIMASSTPLCIFPIQDLLDLGSESLINIPGIVSPMNWSWRFSLQQLRTIDVEKLKYRLHLYGRLNQG